MATGEERTFDIEGVMYQARVIGPLGKAPMRRWWKPWGRLAQPLFEWVEFSSEQVEVPDRARTLVEGGSLSSLSASELSRRFAVALEHAKIPPANEALAFVRNGGEFVLARGDWNCIQATALIVGWEPRSSDSVTDQEAKELARMYRDLANRLDRKTMKEMGLEPPAGLVDFLDGGGFQVSRIG